MEEKDEWVFYKEIIWDDPKNNMFNVDTRDFHTGYLFSEKTHKDFKTLSKYKHFFFTQEELVVLIDRLFKESGGVGEWRMLDLESKDNRVRNWNLKYLRIFRTELGFLVCNSHYVAIPKDILSSKVEQEYLSHH